MKVAIVHDWLVTYGGAERVLEQMLATFPDAQLFSLLYRMPRQQRGFLGGRQVQTSFLQHIPSIGRTYRRFLPLMPAAVERFDFTGFDLVLSSSSAVVRGVLTTPDQLHICYLQARNLKYAYEDRGRYPGGSVRRLAEDLLLTRVRMWDSVAARRPDRTIANSRYVKAWHQHRHGVVSDVIYPPVNTDLMMPFYQPAKDSYFVTVGRLEPYKRMDLVVEAFRDIPARLVVVGEGTQSTALRRQASSNVEFLGYCEPKKVAELVSRARAFVFASREDFGIAPLEAQACGTPVIALGRGGTVETIRGLDDPRPTGVFFEEQTAASLGAAVLRFNREEARILPEACRENAQRFSGGRFRQEIKQYVDHQLAAARETRCLNF
jgi:glycosyltransferase involved in cell wall biosynthesis